MKNLLMLTDLTRNELTRILETATQMRRIVLSDFKRGPQLIGHTVGGVWKKPCTSSVAFQLAASYLSGNCIPVYGSENEQAQCVTLINMGVNSLVVSCDNENMFRSLCMQGKTHVINGGSRQYDPIGVLADLLTLYTKRDTVSNLNVLAVGNRDVNKVGELMYCLQLFGSSLMWYLPADDIVTVRKGIVVDNPRAAFAGADAVLDLGLTDFSDGERYYGSNGGITRELMDLASIDCPLLCGRNIVEYEHSTLVTRDSCYVAVAMAVLYMFQHD